MNAVEIEDTSAPQVPSWALCTHSHLPPVVPSSTPGTRLHFCDLTSITWRTWTVQPVTFGAISFPQCRSLQPPVLCVDQNFGAFFCCESPTAGLYHSVSGRWLAEGYLNCFQFGPVTNHTRHSWRDFCVATRFHFSLTNAKMHSVGCWDCTLSAC